MEQEVKEGLEVSQGALLGQIDDSQARMAKEVAESKYRAAKTEADSNVVERDAMKKVDLTTAQFNILKEANRKAPQAVSQYELSSRGSSVKRATCRSSKRSMNGRSTV